MGKSQRGVRTGDGPFSGSFRRKSEGKAMGRRRAAGQKCPVKKGK